MRRIDHVETPNRLEHDWMRPRLFGHQLEHQRRQQHIRCETITGAPGLHHQYRQHRHQQARHAGVMADLRPDGQRQRAQRPGQQHGQGGGPLRAQEHAQYGEQQQGTQVHQFVCQ